MKRVYLAILPLAAALSACDASVDKLSRAADSARTATEHMANLSIDASNQKENKILADARDLAATQAAQAGLDTGERPRYELRKDPDGWTVYDTANNTAARVGPKPQAGMSREEAERAFASLNADEKRTQQQFTPGGPSDQTNP
jgi:hypothetical protein